MNWQIFSTLGYLGLAFLLIAVLFLIAYWRRQLPWFCYAAATLAIAAFICAKINSATHVNRIGTIPSAPTVQIGSREDDIRRAALDGRGSDVAQITFAEDGAGEALDKAGMDEADLKYFFGSDPSATPEWKRHKETRSGVDPKDTSPEELLEAQIGGAEKSAGVDVETPGAWDESPQLLMSEAEVATANLLDQWNLTITRFLIFATLLLLVIDYFRRANNYALATFPLPVPSAWLNAFTPMPPQVIRPEPPRRSIPAELEWLSRRGDSFVYLTDSPGAANDALAHLQTLPKRRQPEVLTITDGEDGPSDEFVFEGLWFGRGSFIVDSATRAQSMLEDFIRRLEQRRSTRARVSQTAHIVWDLSDPIPEAARETLIKLAQSTGFSLFTCPKFAPTT